jgi:hypothetical protein
VRFEFTNELVSVIFTERHSPAATLPRASSPNQRGYVVVFWLYLFYFVGLCYYAGQQTMYVEQPLRSPARSGHHLIFHAYFFQGVLSPHISRWLGVFDPHDFDWVANGEGVGDQAQLTKIPRCTKLKSLACA